MKFYCFPKIQTYCSVYSSYSVFKTKLFSNFILQTSPKNSLLFRLRKTYLGHLLSKGLTIDIDVPNPNSEYVGIRKTNKVILVEFKNNAPTHVWKKDNASIWEKENFLGYQIISELSLREFNSQKGIIKKALSEHWTNLNKSIYNIHGDFTHFNILYNGKEIYLIDKKEMINSKLYDFFYFYAYLKQSIDQNLNMKKHEKTKILGIINLLLQEVCIYENNIIFEKDFENIKLKSDSGIAISNQRKYLNEFHKIFSN